MTRNIIWKQGKHTHNEYFRLNVGFHEQQSCSRQAADPRLLNEVQELWQTLSK